jgi:hypothetical protein
MHLGYGKEIGAKACNVHINFNNLLDIFEP